MQLTVVAEKILAGKEAGFQHRSHDAFFDETPRSTKKLPD